MNRIEREKRTVSRMITIYCHNHHHNDRMCEECRALEEYAHQRLSHCKFGERKTSCKQCTVHCYKPEMRRAIAKVMRYSGPRMLLYHPLAALRHCLGK